MGKTSEKTLYARWMRCYDRAKKELEEHGKLGKHSSAFFRNQRKLLTENLLSEERKNILLELLKNTVYGCKYLYAYESKAENFKKRFNELKYFYDQNSHSNIFRGYNNSLYSWAYYNSYNKKNLSNDKILLFDSIDFKWRDSCLK
jgi:hypothetical protein